MFHGDAQSTYIAVVVILFGTAALMHIIRNFIEDWFDTEMGPDATEIGAQQVIQHGARAASMGMQAAAIGAIAETGIAERLLKKEVQEPAESGTGNATKLGKKASDADKPGDIPDTKKGSSVSDAPDFDKNAFQDKNSSDKPGPSTSQDSPKDQPKDQPPDGSLPVPPPPDEKKHETQQQEQPTLRFDRTEATLQKARPWANKAGQIGRKAGAITGGAIGALATPILGAAGWRAGAAIGGMIGGLTGRSIGFATGYTRHSLPHATRFVTNSRQAAAASFRQAKQAGKGNASAIGRAALTTAKQGAKGIRHIATGIAGTVSGGSTTVARTFNAAMALRNPITNVRQPSEWKIERRSQKAGAMEKGKAASPVPQTIQTVKRVQSPLQQTGRQVPHRFEKLQRSYQPTAKNHRYVTQLAQDHQMPVYAKKQYRIAYPITTTATSPKAQPIRPKTKVVPKSTVTTAAKSVNRAQATKETYRERAVQLVQKQRPPRQQPQHSYHVSFGVSRYSKPFSSPPHLDDSLKTDKSKEK